VTGTATQREEEEEVVVGALPHLAKVKVKSKDKEGVTR
jgi:hypothetical protein